MEGVKDRPFLGISGSGNRKRRHKDDGSESILSEIQERSRWEEEEDVQTLYESQVATLRGKFKSSHEKIYVPPRGTVLVSRVTEQDVVEFHTAFQSEANGLMNLDMFEENLKIRAQVVLPRDELTTLFLKIDVNKDGFISWDDFLSYLLLEMKEKDSKDDIEELGLPVSGYPRLLKTHHRLPVIRITFLPILLADRSVSFLRGRYVTASRDGMIHYWTLDFEMEGTHYSECPELKIRPTWITDMVCLPDVNIICTSSTERDLRFYDCTARKFELRIRINRLDFPVTCLWYSFQQDIKRDSKLVAGTTSGSVLVFSFTSINKGPFFFTPVNYLTTMRYEKVLRGELPKMKVKEYNNVHADWVKQVGYYPNMNSFLSCAAVSDNSLIMVDSQDKQTSFNVAKGINCFTIDEASHVVVTGGVDCAVRIWNVFVPNKPSSVFLGHHSPVVAVISQQNVKRVFSLDKDKCIKVWDAPSQNCIQTYIGLPQEVGGSGLCTLYNPSNRNLVVGGHKMALLVLGVVVDTQRSDGFTHSMSVVRCLYNPLFKCVVTVGLDSLIMVWDPWEGKRIVLVRNAHTRAYYGNLRAVEITAATFEPNYQLLLTGARDGTLKVWNFNLGTCVRSISIELFCEVTNVIWLKGRILAVGWNRHVTEFSDDPLVSEVKIWETRHTDDVLCAAACGKQALATSSHQGELVLWRLETGQVYRRYSVAEPKTRIILTYQSEAKGKARHSILTAGTVAGMRNAATYQKAVRSSHQYPKDQTPEAKVDLNMPKGKPGELKDIVLSRLTIMERKYDMASSVMAQRSSLQHDRKQSQQHADHVHREWMEKRKARKVSDVRIPGAGVKTRLTSATALLFLQTRPMKPDWGTLVVALDNGLIQMWSHHTAGGILTNFASIHMAGDYVCTMTTDPENKLLFTGTALGYIKVWLMENYAFPDCEKVHINMPKLRLEFPFLWKDRVEGRAKRSLRNQKWPLLVNSYRGHLMTINQIECLMESKIVITCSSDATCRLWTLSGLYIGTLGSVHEWNKLNLLGSGGENSEYRIPPDVHLVASSTTMKVLKGGDVPRTHFKLVDDSELLRDLPARLVEATTYGRRATFPVLGKHFEIPHNDIEETRYKIECFGGNVPVYRHLRCLDLDEIRLPPVPKALKRMRRVDNLTADGNAEANIRSTHSFVDTSRRSVHASRSESLLVDLSGERQQHLSGDLNSEDSDSN